MMMALLSKLYIVVFLKGCRVLLGLISNSKLYRDHPFETSAFFRGAGVKKLQNLPTVSSKKLPTIAG